MIKDTLGDKMKEFEMVEAGRKLSYPICIRLDGRGFSKFTRHLKRPYDERLSSLMIDATKALVIETGARIGYTQSDEISLIILDPNIEKETTGYFGLRAQKLCSITAAFVSAFFAREISSRIPERAGSSPLFDSRAWSVPTEIDAAAVLLWRELDARKNAATMAASCYFSHNFLLNKTGAEKIALLKDKGVDFDQYPNFFKRGTYIKRLEVRGKFSPEEIENLPEKHAARSNPNLEFVRFRIEEFDMPYPLAQIKNRTEFLFRNDEPMI